MWTTIKKQHKIIEKEVWLDHSNPQDSVSKTRRISKRINLPALSCFCPI
jgi:hypothetical protein